MRNFLNKTIPKVIGFILNILSFISPRLAAKQALKLFATPRQGSIQRSQEAFLGTSKHKQLKYHDVQISTYQWEGKGKTILLAHGWESNSFRWHKLIKILKQHNFNVVALDAPAHGNSGGKEFNAILYAEFINVVAKHFKPLVIIGHSVGGMASVFFQKKFQLKSLEKMVLLGAPSEFVNVFQNYTSLMGYNSHLRKHLRKLIIKRFGNTPESFSTALYLKDFKLEGLIVHDKKDKIISYDEAMLINNSFRNATLFTTEGRGHSLHHDTVNLRILEFLNS